MTVGTWYMVHTGIYLENGKKFFPASCGNVEIFVRIQVMNGMKVAGAEAPATLEFSDGKKVIQSILVKAGSSLSNRSAK